MYQSIGLKIMAPAVLPKEMDLDGTIWEVSNGYIFDQAGKLIDGATIDLVFNATGKPLDPTTPPYVTDGTYSAWTDHSPYEIAVLFHADGYTDKKVQIVKLLDTPDVTLSKSSGMEIQGWQIALVLAAVYAYSRSNKKKVGSLQAGDFINIALIIGGVISFGLVKKILEGLGFWGGGNVTAEQEDPNSAFKPDYWQQFTTYTYALTESQAKDFCYTIYNAFGVTSDNYNAILNVFKQMKTKANVSFLAWKFAKEYDEDLLSFLTNGGGILPWDGLSTSHMNVILALVKKLPKN